MLGKKKKAKAKDEIAELKDLLLLETDRDDAGILELAKKGALMSDLHLNKISRVREIVEKL